VELGVTNIDTAHYYGPDVANALIRSALHPYPEDLVIVTKVGARRDAQGGWHAAGAPEELRAGVRDNLLSLALERLPIVNLRVTSAEADQLFDDQIATMIDLRAQGLVRSFRSPSSRSFHSVHGCGEPRTQSPCRDRDGATARGDACPDRARLVAGVFGERTSHPGYFFGSHLEENVAAADITLDARALKALEAASAPRIANGR
jgi:aryl-alcohol dehydrogenase-like predicted oxidoreductase